MGKSKKNRNKTAKINGKKDNEIYEKSNKEDKGLVNGTFYNKENNKVCSDNLPLTPDSISSIEEKIRNELTQEKKSAKEYIPKPVNLSCLPVENKLAPIPEVISEDYREDLEFKIPFNLFEHLKGELNIHEIDLDYKVKNERIYNFFQVPKKFEKLMIFGYFICLNSILYNFTMLPLRIIMACFTLSSYPIKGKRLNNVQYCDLVKGGLIISSCIVLSYVDLSKLYHLVRGQSVVKLYVIFNMLEIADKLLSSLGQDLLNSLFSDLVIGSTKNNLFSLKPIIQIFAAAIYIPFHTIVLLYQMMSLNVSVNSYNDALLSLLMSSQFVEIKGAVFKKFERENLFQLTCADIVERFQLTLFLSAITLRNMIELLNSGVDEIQISMPKSFQKFLPNSIDFAFDLFLSPAVIVLICEILVDWIKHSFVTKFNHIRPTVYTRYLDILCKDLVRPPPHLNELENRSPSAKFPDQSYVVARRIGLSIFPLTCLIVRVAMQLINFTSISSLFSLNYLIQFINKIRLIRENPKQQIINLYSSFQESNFPSYFIIIILILICLTLIKVLLSINLLRFSISQLDQVDLRETEDKKAAKEDLDSFYKESVAVRKELENSFNQDVYRPKNLNLDNIDRFALFKSRVP